MSDPLASFINFKVVLNLRIFYHVWNIAQIEKYIVHE